MSDNCIEYLFGHAAKAGFSTASAYRIEADPWLPSQKEEAADAGVSSLG
jgi:hypothetical protein